MFDAFHLPGLRADDIVDYDAQGPAEAPWRAPRLRHAAIARLARELRQRTDRLRRRSLASIVECIDRTAQRLQDPADPVRRQAQAMIPAVTGYAPEMVDQILDHMVPDWRAPALERLLAAEFRDPGVLDGFRRDAVRGTELHATGPDLTVHVLAGNVPGVAVTSVIRALLVKSPSLAKTAYREPILPVLFTRTLAEIDPELGECVAVCWWPGTAEAATRAALEHADTVLVYGGEDATRAARALTPDPSRVLEHGPRIGFGIIAREALSDTTGTLELAQTVARVTALFDQQGCVSPQLVYVEDGGGTPPRDFAALVARALEDLQPVLPPGALDAAEAAAIHAFRASAEFRSIGGQAVELFASADTSATVVFEADPTFAASPLNRVLRIKPVSSLDSVPALVQPVRRYLQTAAVAGPADRTAALAPRLAEAGVTRITTFQSMPFPPPFWHHDGRGPLRELVRWSEREG